MKRLHLLELEDQPWCPKAVRDGATDYLEIVQDVADVFRPIARRLATALQRSHTRTVVDLCSGGAGPWPRLLKGLEREGVTPEVLLTDLHPNEAAFTRAEKKSNGAMRGIRSRVDATQVPEALRGFRTLFNGFHHFRPEAAREILADAVRRREGIAIFEVVERTPLAMLQILPTAFAVMALTPLMRPFRWSRLALTYLLPAIPAIVLFDGLVSCLRVYSPEELRALVAELGDTDYDWDIGRVSGRVPMGITYLIGTPRLTG